MKKFLMLAVSLLIAAPACAITEQEAHDLFDHLIGQQTDPAITSCINVAISRMVAQTGVAPDTAIFMDGFAEFLHVMFRIAQSGSHARPDDMAGVLTELTKRAYTLRMNVDCWNNIDPVAFEAGTFSECLPTNLTTAFMIANSNSELVQRSPLALLANAAALAQYISWIRQGLQQADKGLGIIQSLIENPAQGLAAVAAALPVAK